MATSSTSTSLSLKFALESGDTRTICISIPKDGLDSDTASACMESMVENGAAFVDPLSSAVSATLTETTKTVLVDNS